jgi:hypothetical protein
MIDNNKDRMSVNILQFSLDRIVRVGGSVRGQSLQHLHHLPDQPTWNQDQFVFVFVETDRPGFSVKSSQGNEVS